MIPVQVIRRGAQGVAVANLQDVLLYWLGRQSALLDLDFDTLIKELTRLLTVERRDSAYKDLTVRTVTFFQQQMAGRFQLKASGDVDDATAAALNQVLGELGVAGFGKADPDHPPKPQSPAFAVSGTVKLADGTPASGIIVQAFDCDLRSQELLGKSQSDNSGAYKIGYTAAQFAKAESGSADLVVKALDAKDAVLVASPILFNAPPQAIIDLTIPAAVRAPPTLFEKIAAALPPLLGVVKIEELEENQQFQDLSFLAGETAFGQRDLARFVVARLSASLGIQAEFWFALLVGALFAYDEGESIKTQFAALLGGLPALGEGSVRKALAAAFDRKDIPAPLQDNVEDWVASFLKIAARLAVRSDTAPSFAKQTLDAAGIKDGAKQEKFALLLNQYGSVTPDMLAALKGDPTFAPAEIADISASYQLADLTGGDFTVVSSIKSAFSVGDPSQIRALAAKSEAEWVDLVKQQAAAGKIDIPVGIGQPAGASPVVAPISNAELYGKTLERQFREAFPTSAFAGGLSRALNDGGASGLSNGPAIRAFLQQNPDFELLTTPVDKYFTGTAAGSQNDEARVELKAVQRVFRLAPSFDATNTLLANGLHSSQGIYRQGRAEFVARYATQPGFTVATANLAWNRAADTHAAALTVVGQIMALDPGGLPAAMQSAGAQVTDFPDWNNLFQAGDLCDCEDCRSVLSPAAYFADLLTFLKDRKAVNPGFTVKDILFKRRPDLGYIELNCDNALAPLPYIDIVCEVLESVVAQGVSDVALTTLTAMPSSNAESAVATALAAASLDAGADFTLAQVTPGDPNRWVVHGDVTTYLLSKTGTAPFSARILWNTKASAEELRAYPAYVDPAAYVALRGAAYPFNLPFDLFAEEVRAAFKKCNLQRWDLMRTLQAPGLPPTPTEGDIAAEYFGIGVSASGAMDEKRLILVADTSGGAGTQAAWGETGNSAWLTKLANVKNFLNKSGLEFVELLALLDLKFINPFGTSGATREIVLQRPDPTCDTDKMTLAGLSALNLDRIHRFVRLWRKLGWKMWEVDFVIRQPALGNGSLDEPFLINLYWLALLRTRLGDKTSVEQMCALFVDLNTETSFTEAYKKRTDGIYQSLFLNKRLVQPIDDAYDLASVTSGTPQQIAAHLSVLLGALQISETDLGVFQALTKASDHSLYVNGDLTLGNISLLWRHVWLSRQLKLKPIEWATILKLSQQDVAEFATPEVAFEFVKRLDLVKAAGLTPDQLDWLLSANLDAKAATNVTMTARFLVSLRKALQAITAQYNPAQYPFLSPPTDTASLSALLASLLLQLGRDAAAAQAFVDTLARTLVQEQIVTGLPETFAFPAILNGTANDIGIRYEPALVFNGSMTDDQLSILQSDISLSTVTSLAAYQQAVTQLHDAPGKPAMVALPAGFNFPPAITGLSNSIPIAYRPVVRLCARSVNAQLQLTGAMTAAQRTTLLTDPSLSAVSGLAEYQQAINALYNTPGQAVLADLPPDFIFPTAIAANIPISISAKAQLQFSGIMTANQKSVLLNDTSLSAVIGLVAYQQAINALFNTPGQPVLADLPSGFVFPASITTGSSPIPISITPVPLAGAITSQQRTDLEALVSGNTSYTNAIESFFSDPLLAVKFFDPKFSAPLGALPAAVDFNTLADSDLASRVAYDTEQHVLTVSGILTAAQKQALDNLSNDSLYAAAVQSLFDQPRAPANSGDAGIWLLEADLQGAPEVNFATAIGRALSYLTTTLSQGLVVRQAAAQLGLTEALARYLLTQYPVMTGSATLLDYLTQTFAPTANAVEYTPSLQPNVFDGWFWADRCATLLKKWKLGVADLQKLDNPAGLGNLPPAAQLLSLGALPFSNPSAIASLDQYLRTSRLLAFRDSLPESDIAFLDVLGDICAGSSPATFAAAVETLNDSWSAADVAKLIAVIDGYSVNFPGTTNDYLLAENWERLRRAFYFLNSLNASADRVLSFAAATMGQPETKTLKELLRSKFGAESWLALSADIQDALRERKRDALSAYLLTLPAPADAPTGKWENSDDLFAYYLLDVEMCSCQLTSRLVRASGSVQLFVQRCFMGLEPAVVVKADGDTGDTAWKWWTWMSKFQVWVANRKVFLWPEDWIRPELKGDTSSFFNDLKNELQQNEINSDNVESAFANYLEKLDGVARLEIAGFYQQDDGDDTILHVFGRTAGTEPHTYYYRRFDYRQWTPWSKVELDIQGDYLIPAVLNGRLFLFWPVFTEMPDEESNAKVDTPDSNQTDVKLQRTRKKLRLQMAVSGYRRDKWTPRRISKDFNESEIYQADIVRTHYHFMPIDRTDLDGRFGIVYDGYSEAVVDGKSALVAGLSGAFELSGCDGGPAAASFPSNFGYAIQPEWNTDEEYSVFMKWIEHSDRQADSQNSLDDFALQVFSGSDSDVTGIVPLLMRTPGLYQMSPPWQLSYMDRLWMQGQAALALLMHEGDTPLGSWLPFFYNDAKRTFLALPAAGGETRGGTNKAGGAYFYPDIKRQLRSMEDLYAAQFAKSFESYRLPLPGTPERQQIDQFLTAQFPLDPSPHSDDRLIALAQQYLMRWMQFYLGRLALTLFKQSRYQFRNFYHPFVCDFMRLVENPLKGIPALMARDNQLEDSGFSFKQTYLPTQSVIDPSTEAFYPREIVDFSPDGAYSSYNWELFFHAPLLIANSLSQNQKFEEARDWYHFIFNPIGVESAIPGGSPMSKYWITKPFYETTDSQYVQQRIDNILNMLNGDAELENQVRDWRDHPFDPHRIANYRTTAYQKTVVMNYLDNLIAWGDFLFRQDSIESIDQATQIYIMAAEILGPRPRKIPPAAKPPLSSFNELEPSFDAFSNAMVQIENLIPQMSGNASGGDGAPLPLLYFCIPQNVKLLGYWDIVADRLYKIDHCMNIEGVVRQLALFERPIDPGALVKAAAGGVDISSALADLNAPLPLYRFNVLLQKANELCADVKALGGALLSALEKKDGEALSLLRQGQEIAVLEATTAVKQQQVDEAKQNLEGTKRSRLVTEARRDFYRDIEQLTSQEKLHLSKLAESQKKQNIAQGIKVGASIMSLLPAINIGASGFGGTPLVTFKYGGLELGQAASAASDVISLLAQIAANDATMASIVAGNDRRWADWKLQEKLANKELDQLDSQIAAGELRVTIAQKDLDNHLAQIDNAKAIDAFMRSKYTNEELYQWQVGQISDVYFQSYKLAYDLAKRTERCFRFELGLQDSSYIKFGYWDSLKKGLLAGETLQYDLRRLDAAYLDKNRREFELTKHVSLQLLDPLALVRLRETGRCIFNLPEQMFDHDYPGHYFRRIKSVSLTLPCVTGPYTTVPCTLRLLKNAIRIDTSNGDNGYPRNTDDSGNPADDTRFVENNIQVQAIATSSGQNDSGVFELNFRDERFLTFEGAGAISQWALELFNDPSSTDFGRALRQFDYETISDAVLHIKYTAREDAGPFKARAIDHLNDYYSQDGVTTALRLFDMRREFPSQWSRFTDPATTSGNTLEFGLFPDLFRAVDAGKTLKINSILILGRCTGVGGSTYTMDVSVPASGWTQSATLAQAGATFGPLFYKSLDVSGQLLTVGPGATPAVWQIALTQSTSAAAFEDVMLVLGYEWE